ncbi:MAG: transporter substrate-binding domain-containing protein [Erysipelothrix sp.]|nr:transporter substrate-binding domain-containing protein [Erysipelothrix sp.]
MKKILLVATTLLLILTGCTSKQDPNKYIIVTDTAFAPFEFTNDKNEFVGIDVDLIKAIADKEGFEIDLQSVGFSAALTALETGQADGLIAGMSISDERKEKYDFSEPYFEVYVTMGVKKDSDITDLEGLRGKSVAVKDGTTSAAYAESVKDEYGFTTTYFESSPVMYQDVVLGNSAAAFEDEPILDYNIKHSGVALKKVESVKTSPTPYGFAVLKGKNDELLSKFNAGLKALKEDGTFDDIKDTYTK